MSKETKNDNTDVFAVHSTLKYSTLWPTYVTYIDVIFFFVFLQNNLDIEGDSDVNSMEIEIVGCFWYSKSFSKT